MLLKWYFLTCTFTCLGVFSDYLPYFISDGTDNVPFMGIVEKCLSKYMVPATLTDLIRDRRIENEIKERSKHERFPPMFWLVNEGACSSPNDVMHWEALQLNSKSCSMYLYGYQSFFWHTTDCNAKLRYICKAAPEYKWPSLMDRLKLKLKWLHLKTKRVLDWSARLVKPKDISDTGEMVTWTIDDNLEDIQMYISGKYDQRNFTEALRSCEQKNMDPLFIQNCQENSRIIKAIGEVMDKENNSASFFWTGGINPIPQCDDESDETDKNNGFMWLPSTLPFTYSSWFTPKGQQACVKLNYYLSGSSWETEYCNKTLRYVCREKYLYVKKI